jgi:hypothetical protein
VDNYIDDNYVIIIKAGPYTELLLPFSITNIEFALKLKLLQNNHNGTFSVNNSQKTILMQIVPKKDVITETNPEDVPF